MKIKKKLYNVISLCTIRDIYMFNREFSATFIFPVIAYFASFLNIAISFSCEIEEKNTK